jgi:hypothetical protein
MAEPVPAGSEGSAGTYERTKCGYELEVELTEHLPSVLRCP